MFQTSLQHNSAITTYPADYSSKHYQLSQLCNVRHYKSCQINDLDDSVLLSTENINKQLVLCVTKLQLHSGKEKVAMQYILQLHRHTDETVSHSKGQKNK